MTEIDPLVAAVAAALGAIVGGIIIAAIVHNGRQRIEAIQAGQDVPDRHENGALGCVLVIMALFAVAVVMTGR